MIKTNKDRLPVKCLTGAVTHLKPGAFGMMTMDSEGRGHYLAGTGGITYNFRLGDSCMDIRGNKVEPGVSTKFSGSSPAGGSPMGSPEEVAYIQYACIGNEAVITSGPLSGRTGYVIGKISGFGVTLGFDSDTTAALRGDEHFLIRAWGTGLQLENAGEEIAVHNIAPDLLERLGLEEEAGGCSIPVKDILPGYLVGPGIGGSVITGDAEIMTDGGELNRQFGLDSLRFGDIIAFTDLDTTSGRTYLEGAVTVGIIVHSDSVAQGDGPGFVTILSSKAPLIRPVKESGANLANHLSLK